MIHENETASTSKSTSLESATTTTSLSCSAPYAYEYGVDNGDGTYSVRIDRGSLVKVGEQSYAYAAPLNPHPDHPVKPLYEREAEVCEKPPHAGSIKRQSMTPEESRATFEAFVRTNLGDVAVSDGGRYISPKIQNYWLTWQASAEAQATQDGS